MRPNRCVPLLASALCLLGAPTPGQERPGYRDTPQLPDQAFRVHDADRPYPPVVTPGPAGAPVPAPAAATVLFDGTDLKGWRGRRGEARWAVADGAMTVNGTGDIETAAHFGDCQLHVEFATPLPAKGEGQGRGNSGVFLMGRYEVQVLDSFGSATYADGQCGALYGQFPPLCNASRAPGEWQTYDIVFEAPRFGDDGQLVTPACVTVIHNGVLLHHRQALLGPTAHRSLPKYTPHATTGPIRLQDHGDAVRYRNLWVRPLRPEPAAATGGDGRRDG